MRYLGLDVHIKATVWHLLDATGQTVETGKTPTTFPKLRELVLRLSKSEELIVAQEVGKMAYLVHDIVTAAGVRILSFNAWHLRMIASSRKKTDRRDAYWLAKSLQTGMTPTPVYLPTGEVRELRAMLSRREAVVTERTRWLLRARSYLQAAGYAPPRAHRSMPRLLEASISSPDGIDATIAESLEVCQRMRATLTLELKRVDGVLHEKATGIEAVQRLLTIPAVGERVALMVYAWVGDARRFRNARELGSYAGLVPSVRQSGEKQTLGGITKMGSPQLRSVLVQAGHVLLWRCQSEESAPLKAIAERVQTARARRKIAVVAAARHILRIAYYVLRDGTTYDPTRLRPAPAKGQAAADSAATTGEVSIPAA
jgi:transposase